ncbi:aldehyde dehydrogenase [Paraburkholderia pallida]|uniref:Aldehyde dehydrogenase n=1 Tax=Paraburkholderia pallida TaxID=2547399 RepID=A0A4P7CSD0_9BURK|nr:aldehyde dehydrogenase [Paraburkholderia pallida]QBQ98850.1 aldehyde dehydrogenase [Paraburkholderia pallida]
MSSAIERDWRALAQSLRIDGRAFIDGKRVDAHDGAVFADVSPADSRVLAHVSACSERDVQLAIAVARRCFDSGVWADASGRERKAVLQRWAQLVRESADELALLETLDVGKPIADTTAIDVPGTIYCLEWFAELADKRVDELVQIDKTQLGYVTREPVGVVAAIVPWNFPLQMAMWKIAPALAAGNSVVLKPSEKSPLTALRIADLARAAGLPDGVLNVLPGDGAVGQMLALHEDVDCVAFTGSTAVGKRVMECAARSNLKRVWLELGGKSPFIVMPDCPDIGHAARSAAAAIFYNAGQICTAASRLLIHTDIYDVFMQAMVDEARRFVPGDPLDIGTTMGAIVDEQHLRRVLGYIDVGRTEARLRCGGRRVRESSGGLFIEPTIFERPAATARIAREEIFGPVLTVFPFDHFDEAIALANSSDYGLGASVWTSNLRLAHEASRRLRAGMVWVNGHDDSGDMNMPFGGIAQSGNGRDNSVHALEKYTELKSTLLRLG